jgi:hypothetical protein
MGPRSRLVRWLHTVLNRGSSQLSRSVTPSDAARRIRSAIFAFVAGVRLATAICSTATSRTDRIFEINSGSKFDAASFGDDGDFSTGNLLLANVVYPSSESAGCIVLIQTECAVRSQPAAQGSNMLY